ncbi:MAG: cytochrome oxidase putative small subunit CydP [Methylocystis sp.]
MRRTSLARDIAGALAFKALALVALYFLFFDHSHKTVVTPAVMAAYLAEQPPMAGPQGHRGE